MIRISQGIPQLKKYFDIMIRANLFGDDVRG